MVAAQQRLVKDSASRVLGEAHFQGDENDSNVRQIDLDISCGGIQRRKVKQQTPSGIASGPITIRQEVPACESMLRAGSAGRGTLTERDSCRAVVQVAMIRLTQMQNQQGAGLWYLQLPSHSLR